MVRINKLVRTLAVVLCIWAAMPLQLNAQVRPVYDRGASGLIQLLKKLSTSASALMIGAHPDDEDTALLAYLARGESARTAYLSLTRGDGGQNIIGPELGEALGLIRTEELIQARRLDGAEQFFGRAYDYGFSKTLAEARSKWNENVILCDTVRVIRTFRPAVVISQFSGTTADGHGQHQFAGYITPLAVKAAADGSQCREAGTPWTVQKLYVRHRGGGEPRLRLNTGRYDPVLGRSYFEIAMEARSQHKSQEQGVLELRGDQFSSLNLTGSEARENGILDGLDLTASSMARSLNVDESRLNAMQTAAAEALAQFDIREPAKIIPHLARGYAAAAALERSAPTAEGRSYFRSRQNLFAEAIMLSAGVQVDALAERETVVPGETFLVGAKAYTQGRSEIKITSLKLMAPSSWTVVTAEAPSSNSPAYISREAASLAAFFNVTPSSNAGLTQPYWLADPREGDLFRWSGDGQYHTLPIQPHPMRLLAAIDVSGTQIEVERPVEYRFADDIRGEIRRNVDVVPRISVELDESMIIVPYSERPQTRSVVVTVTNHSTRPAAGNVSLNINSDREWPQAAKSRTFELKRTGERAAIAIEVTIPARTRAGSYQIAANASVGEGLASSTMRTVAYPHIQTHRFYRRALADVRVIDLKTAAVKVGYLAGSGDRVPEAIRQMGFDLEMISENELAGGNLSRFDVIVVGIRAYQVRPDIVANNERLLDYARQGGTLIVQYQLPGYAQQNLMPFPVQMGPRVADENAPMKILVPVHPIFNFPNKITDADFEGWVQERNLYNFRDLPAEYTGLIESHDPGEAENKGGLVIAKLGKGNYIYCSYSMFRQLPAGVPGAYRMFANLLSLPRHGQR